MAFLRWRSGRPSPFPPPRRCRRRRQIDEDTCRNVRRRRRSGCRKGHHLNAAPLRRLRRAQRGREVRERHSRGGGDIQARNRPAWVCGPLVAVVGHQPAQGPRPRSHHQHGGRRPPPQRRSASPARPRRQPAAVSSSSAAQVTTWATGTLSTRPRRGQAPVNRGAWRCKTMPTAPWPRAQRAHVLRIGDLVIQQHRAGPRLESANRRAPVQPPSPPPPGGRRPAAGVGRSADCRPAAARARARTAR